MTFRRHEALQQGLTHAAMTPYSGAGIGTSFTSNLLLNVTILWFYTGVTQPRFRIISLARARDLIVTPPGMPKD